MSDENDKIENNVIESNDTGINEIKKLDNMKKILRLVELKRELKENLDLTNKIVSDLKIFATISILVMLVGIIFLVLKYSRVDPSSLKIVYTTITGSIGSLGILKTAYDWFNGQNTLMVEKDTFVISDYDLKTYSDSIERSKQSFPNNELEYIYHLDLAIDTIKKRNYCLKSSNTRRFISFMINAFILTALVLMSIFFGFFTTKDVIQDHKLIAFIADDFLIIGGFFGLLDCLCVYLIIYKPEYFKNRFHSAIFIIGLSINGFCRNGFIKQIKVLVKNYRRHESGDIARQILVTIKTIIDTEKSFVKLEAANDKDNIWDLLEMFGLNTIPDDIVMKKQNFLPEDNKNLIHKIIIEYIVGLDEDLKKSSGEIVNAIKELKKEIIDEILEKHFNLILFNLFKVKGIKIEKIQSKKTLEEKKSFEKIEGTIEKYKKKIKEELKKLFDEILENGEYLTIIQIKKTLEEKEILKKIGEIREKLKKEVEETEGVEEAGGVEEAKEVEEAEEVREKKVGEILEKHLGEYFEKMQSKHTLEEKITKKIIPFLCSRSIFERDIKIRLPLIKRKYLIFRVTLQDSEKVNIERLLYGLHYDREDVKIDILSD